MNLDNYFKSYSAQKSTIPLLLFDSSDDFLWNLRWTSHLSVLNVLKPVQSGDIVNTLWDVAFVDVSYE